MPSMRQALTWRWVQNPGYTLHLLQDVPAPYRCLLLLYAGGQWSRYSGAEASCVDWLAGCLHQRGERVPNRSFLSHANAQEPNTQSERTTVHSTCRPQNLIWGSWGCLSHIVKAVLGSPSCVLGKGTAGLMPVFGKHSNGCVTSVVLRSTKKKLATLTKPNDMRTISS
ncbi:unnamed protein product [Boreogadus saida]